MPILNRINMNINAYKTDKKERKIINLTDNKYYSQIKNKKTNLNIKYTQESCESNNNINKDNFSEKEIDLKFENFSTSIKQIK